MHSATQPTPSFGRHEQGRRLLATLMLAIALWACCAVAGFCAGAPPPLPDAVIDHEKC